MKILALFLLLQGSLSFADSYQITVSDSDLGKIILAKNCLDYQFCGGEGSSLGGGNPEFRLHAFISLNERELSVAMQQCNFSQSGLKVSVKNLTKNAPTPLVAALGASDLEQKNPNVFLPALTASQKLEKFNMVKTLIDQKKFLQAINTVMFEYGLNNGGYAITLGGDMGKAGAVTDHELKSIRISDSAFQHACVLIQTVRHELEHVSQVAKVNSCYAKGKNHNLADHVTRERSAYLNDIRNIPLFCPAEKISDILVDGTSEIFFNSYTRK